MTESIAHGLPTPQGGFVIAQTADPAVLELRHGSVRVGSDLDQPAQASQSGPRDRLRVVLHLEGPRGPRAAVIAALEFLQGIVSGWGASAELELRREGEPIPYQQVRDVSMFRGFIGQDGPTVVRHDRVAGIADHEDFSSDSFVFPVDRAV